MSALVAERVTGSGPRWRRRTRAAVPLWALVVAVLGGAGVFAAAPVPAIALFVVMGAAAPLVLYAANPGFRAYLDAVPIERLTAFHVWRILAALLLWTAGADGALPPAFVRNAAWGDLAVGCAAILLLMSRRTPQRYLAFHLFGLLDFVVAVGTGLSYAVAGDPAMAAIARLPLVLIPLFGVPVSGVSHIIAIRRLLRSV